jgi:hypothetical protein
VRQASSSSTSRECYHILATQMGYMWCKAVLAMVLLASLIGSGRVWSSSSHRSYEMILSNNRATDNDVNAAVDDVRV